MIAETALEDTWESRPEGAVTACKALDSSDSRVRFAGGIAHDFNNLLTVINGYSELLLAGETDPERCQDYIRQIFSAGTKAAEVVDKILAYAGKPAATTDVFDANRWLESMRDYFSYSVGNGIALSLDLCPEPVPVRGDSGRFLWALTNILMNSKEAMPGGGRVRLATRRVAGGSHACPRSDLRSPRAEISIRDTGHGMTKEELDSVFEPYFSTKVRSHVPGQGLGLAGAQGIMRQMGGCIRAESELGKGSAFHLCLPLAEIP
jgi:signal transduction histidine kinase